MKRFINIFTALILSFSGVVSADTPPPQRIGVYGIYNGPTPPTVAASGTAPLQMDSNGSLRVHVASGTIATAANQLNIISEIQNLGTAQSLGFTTVNNSIVSQTNILSDFKEDNHTDLLQLDSSLGFLNTDLNIFASANHSDLLLVNSSVVSNTTILGGKLDTVSSNIIANTASTSAALSTNTAAVTSGSNGIISAVNAASTNIIGAVSSGSAAIVAGLTTNTQASVSGSNGIIASVVSNTQAVNSNGATLAANQATQIANQVLLQSSVSGTNSRLDSANTKLDAVNSNLVTVQNNQSTQISNQNLLQATASATAASVSSIDGKVSTSALQTSGNTILSNILAALDVNLSTRASAANQVLLQSTASATATSVASIDNKVATAANQSLLQATASATATSVASIDTKTTTVNNNLVTIQGKQDLLQASASGTNTRLDTVNSNLVTVQNNQSTQITNQNLLQASVSGTNSRIDSTNTKLDTVNSNLVTVQGNQSTQISNQNLLQSSVSGTNSRLDTVNTNLGTIDATNSTGFAGLNNRLGNTNELAASSDTANSGLNGLTKRVAQNITSLTGTVSSSLAASGSTMPAMVQAVGGRSPDGTIRGFTTTANGSQNGVIRQPTNPNTYASISNGNRLRVTVEPSTQANDKFDGAVLDTNIWTTNVGGTGSATIGTGSLVVSTGTTTSNFAYITTVDNAQAPGNAFLQFGAAMKFETTTLATNTRRYWGFATGGGSYATPLTDGVIFEIDESQSIRASIYQGGTRVFTSILTGASCALDGNFHRWDIFYNTMNIAWYLDCFGGQDMPIAQVTNGTNPNVQNLPARIAMFNNTAASPSITPVMQSLAFAVTDTAHNGQWLVDGRYPTRRATVESGGGLRVSTKSPLTWANPTSATVTSASTPMVAANTQRGGVVISNISNGLIFLNLNGGTAILNAGIPIYPGGNFQMDEGTFSTSAITGICSLSSCATAIQESSRP